MRKRKIAIILLVSFINSNVTFVKATDNIAGSEEITTEQMMEDIKSEDKIINDNNQNNEELENDYDKKNDEFDYINNKSENQNEELKNDGNIEELTGKIYEKESYNLNSRYKFDAYNYKEEFILDHKGLESLYKLKPKTNENYELILSKDDGEYVYLDSFNNENEGKIKLKKIKANINKGIITVINREGRIVYAEKSIGRIIKHINGDVDPTVNNITEIYPNEELKNKFTYINHGYIDDVPIIENKGDRIKVQIAGYKGWIKNDINSGNFDVVIVPLNQVRNLSYYIVKDGQLKHFISNDIMTDNKGYEIVIGKAPNYLIENKKYYSYDANYFYNSIEELIEDNKVNSIDRSINKNDKYYSYYTNLPYRSKTNFSATELNDFINLKSDQKSKLRGSGQALIDAQNKYGVNAILILGIAINESAWGMSKIAQEKNNIFGINAIDSNPGQAANYFETISQCIDEFAKNYISRGYSDPTDWRYNGGILGDKSKGTNVNYASDPFWSEKASSHSFKIDFGLSGEYINNLKDYDFYQLAVVNEDKDVLDINGNLLYKIKDISFKDSGVKNSPVIIKDDYSNEGWYAIYPERTSAVNSGGNSNKFDGYYNWSKGYVGKQNIQLINKGKSNNLEHIGIIYQVKGEGYEWQDWVKDGELAGTIGKAKKIEAIKIKTNNLPSEIKLEYRIKVDGESRFRNWAKENEVCSIVGENKKIEAIEIKLTGENSYKYDIEYRVHLEDYEWQPWTKNGESAGRVNGAKRIEGIEIKLSKKEIEEEDSRVIYQVQGEDYGWQDWIAEGRVAGTVGEYKRMEAIRIKALNLPDGVNLMYRTHVEGDGGFGEWKNNGEIAGTVGEYKRMEAIEIKLVGRNAYKYNVEYRVQGEDYGWQSWVENGKMAGTMGLSKRIEAIEIKLAYSDELKKDDVQVKYQVQGQDYGWQNWVSEGELAGTINQQKRIEAIKIESNNLPDNIELEYRTHVEGDGWFQEWVKEGEISGTVGKFRRMEAIQIRLKGENSYKYDVEYRVNGEGYGWQPWVKNGETAGTLGKSKRIEAIEIKIVPTGLKADKPQIIYQAQCENYGWKEWSKEGKLAGTAGEGLRLEALKLELINNNENLGLQYRVHVEGDGTFRRWENEGNIAGTVGEYKRIEAIEIKLTGTDAKKYKLLYRSHIENDGWQEWVENGEMAGTMGMSKRLEGIEIVLLKK